MPASHPLHSTPDFLAQARSGHCPQCGQELGRHHAYWVPPQAVLDGLTQCPPLHYACALERWRQAVETDEMEILWVVKSSSMGVATARVFKDGPPGGETRWLHLFTPERMEFIHAETGCPFLDYTRIRRFLQPVTTRAVIQAQGNEEELDAIAQRLAWLHAFLPKRPAGTPREIESGFD